MSQRQSTTPVAPSEKTMEAARDLLSARQRNLPSSMSFIALGDSQASKVVQLPGFAGSSVSGEPSGCFRNDDDDVVALSQEDMDKASRAKSLRPMERKKWSLAADLHLMAVATKHEVWCVPRSERTVKEKWEAVHEELQQEPAVRMFAAMKRRAIESRFDHLVRKQGSKNSAASRASGCGNTSADVMTEDEAKLEKLTMAVVDAKAGIKADKREERLKNADKNILGAAAVGMGRRRCGPGAGATPFGDARASDDHTVDDVLRRRNSGVGAMTSGRTSDSSSGGRSSPGSSRGTPAGVPALGDELSFEMGVLDTDELGKVAGATLEELDLFVNRGFLVEQIDRERVVKIMEEVIKSRLKKVWGGKGLLEFINDESAYDISSDSVVGLGSLCLAALCAHYGVADEDFCAMDLKANWFVNGWRVEDNPTPDEFDRLTNALASMLLDGHYSTGPTKGGADTPPSGGPSRQSKSGRKTRKNTDRKDEGSLEGMFEKSLRESKERGQENVRREERKEKRRLEEVGENRKLRRIELDAEKDLRAEERAAAAAREDAIRREDREERRKEREAAEAREERRLQDRKEERAHQIAMLQLQLELSKKQG